MAKVPSPPGTEKYFASTGYEQDARDWVQLRLGLASLVTWMVVAFGVVAILSSTGGVLRPAFLLALGIFALLPAALPWLAFDRLVRERMQKLAQQDQARQ